MTLSFDQILPSLQSLGDLAYWLFGLASALEGFFLSGVVVPGTLIVDAGGLLVHRGLLDYVDLVWFVAVGSIVGFEFSYWMGRLARKGNTHHQKVESSRTFQRAKALLIRHGGLALMIGRFLGPVSGLVALTAAMSGMDRRKFVFWNVLSSVPYALAHVSLGYFLADILAYMGGSLTRVAVLCGVVLILLLAMWGVLFTALRLLPLALALLWSALHRFHHLPVVAHWESAHPKTLHWAKARFDRTSFSGLPLTTLAVIFCYVFGVFLDSTLDFLADDPMVLLDQRLAELIYHFQAPVPISMASIITAAGGWQSVVPLATATLVMTLINGRRWLAIGLLVSLIGNTVSVSLLKQAFGRERSALGYYTETSGSFPSGHAAASIAFFGMAMFILWRSGRLRIETALLGGAVIAFAIGVSRIYLIEHYLSDVLNGWLVGLLWMIAGITIAEWLASSRFSWASGKGADGWQYIAGLGVAVSLVAWAAVNVWHYDHPRNTPYSLADVVIPDVNALSAKGELPPMTESLLGSPLHPISFILLAHDEADVTRAMGSAGWAERQSPTAGYYLDTLYKALEGGKDPSVEIIPHFWRGGPNDQAFVQVAKDVPETQGKPLHTRIWKTEFVTADGWRAFAGAVSIDEDEKVDGAARTSGERFGRTLVEQELQDHGGTVIDDIELQSQDGSYQAKVAILQLSRSGAAQQE